MAVRVFPLPGMPGGAGDVEDPMSDLTMPADVREAFVADPRVGVLSIAREAGAPPLSTPVWYLYEPGGKVIINIGRDSEKARLLDRRLTDGQHVRADRDAPPTGSSPSRVRSRSASRTRRSGAKEFATLPPGRSARGLPGIR